MIKIYYAETDSTLSLEEMEHLAEKLSPEKQKRFFSLRFSEDRQRMLAGDQLLRSVLAESMHCPPNDIIFRTTKYGKPYLPDSKDLFFNLSHSGNFVVAVFSSEEAGIDIEEIKPLKDHLSQARVFMSDREFSFFSNLMQEDQQLWFYRIWSAKESFIKRTGKGIFENLQSITIDFTCEKIQVYRDEVLLTGISLHEICIDPHYAGFVCVSDTLISNCVPVKIQL